MSPPKYTTQPHSHDWRDVRFIGHVWDDAGQPYRDEYILPGQKYRCIQCGDEIHVDRDSHATYVRYGK